MGFYLRKSVKVGPFRFNLSKSGVGVSAGIKGLRIGTGPRGNYVQMGRNGVYYRATLPPSRASPRSRPRTDEDNDVPSGTHAPLEEIDSADVSQIVDSSSAELLEELNQKRRKTRLWPVALALTLIILSIAVASNSPPWVIVLLVMLGGSAVYIAFNRDLLAKSVVLFYDFDNELEAAFEQLHLRGEQLASCSRTWHIQAEGRVYDPKYHAGANNLVRRKPTFIKKSEPPYVKTNVETLAIGVGSQVLHFFPDRLLVYALDGVGAVSYSNLELGSRSTRFIEDDGVPTDAEIVDRTWKYVNKRGGPDKRFNNNYELPICLYGEVLFSSPTGLNEVIQVSRSDVADGFVEAIESLASKVPAG